MTFGEALATQPDWVRLWVGWLNIAVIGAVAICLLRRRTWPEAGAILAANALMVPSMLWLYGQVGFVRLLGLPHLVFWTPMLAVVLWRLRRAPPPGPQRHVLWLFAATIAVSLAFDATDVARYLLGERQSLVPDSR